MQVQLIVTDKHQSSQAIPVNVPAFRIGQAEDCHLRSNSSRVSPQHCVIHTHNDTVTVMDLGGEIGTHVNGKRIVSPQVLKDGDTLTVGRHTFVMSIQSGMKQPVAAQPAAGQHEVFELAADSAMNHDTKPEQEVEVMFEIRYKGQTVSVTKERLFQLARQGALLSDDIVTVAGTKIFADSIHGIVFGNESSDPFPKTDSGARSSETRPLENHTAGSFSHGTLAPHDSSTSVEESAPFDITNEPRVQIERVPGARKDVTFSDLGKQLVEEPLNQATTWLGSNVAGRHIVTACSVLVALCLLGALVMWLLPKEKSLYDAVPIVGILTLDGKPVVGASVTLSPRDDKNDLFARGATNKNGRFTVRTGSDPQPLGAVPGKYDVTFRKKGEIPQKYENVETSGLDPIVVEHGGQSKFTFELSSGATSTQPTTGFGTTFSAPQPIAEANTRTATIATTSPPAPSPPLPDPPPQPQPSSFPNIWEAAARGTVEDIEFFIGKGVSVNEGNNVGDTPLHRAAASNTDAAVATFLIAQRANVNAGNNAGDTPLHLAARNNPNVEILQTLSKNANVNARNNVGRTPLDLARLDLANAERKSQILLGAGAQSSRPPSQPRPTDQPPTRTFASIFDAVSRGTESEVQPLLEAESSVNHMDADGRTLLHLAARSNSDAGVVNLLISKGADVHSTSPRKQTPLHLAAMSNPNVDVLKTLVDRGSSINLRDEHGDTPLHLAARFNSEAVLRHLLSRSDKGIEISPRNINGATPLDSADTEEKQQILREAGASGGRGQ